MTHVVRKTNVSGVQKALNAITLFSKHKYGPQWNSLKQQIVGDLYFF